MILKRMKQRRNKAWEHYRVFTKQKKKDGSLYYRTSITYHSKHISIGSYNKEEAANAAYREARKLLDANTLYSPDDYHPDDFPHPFLSEMDLSDQF